MAEARPTGRPRLPVPAQVIEQRIFLLRGQKVMLSPHLAELYEVETRALVQAVKRNKGRFPEDFMFALTRAEHENLKSQFVISSWGGARRGTSYAFTEQGVAMLSSVLHSRRAVQVSIAIVRVFVKLWGLLATHKELARRLDEIERKQQMQGAQIAGIYDLVKQLMAPVAAQTRRRIGFAPDRPE